MKWLQRLDSHQHLIA